MNASGGAGAGPGGTPWLAAAAAVALFLGVVLVRAPAYLEHPVWDEALLWSVAQQGYTLPEGDYTTTQPINTVVYPPAWPLLLRVGAMLTGNHPGVRLALAALLLPPSLWLLSRLLARLEGDPRVVRRTVWLFAFGPGAMFFLTGYSEPLYLLCTVAFFGALLGGRHGWAAVAGAAAILTKSSGWAFALTHLVALGIEAWRQDDARVAMRVLARRLVLLAPIYAAAPAIYMALLARDVGDPWAWTKGYAAWIRVVLPGLEPWVVPEHFGRAAVRASELPTVWVALPWFLAVPLVVALGRRGLPFVVVAACAIYWGMLLVRDTPELPLVDALRWTSVLFPVHLLVVRGLDRAGSLGSLLYAALLAGGAAFNLWCVDAFAHGRWVS